MVPINRVDIVSNKETNLEPLIEQFRHEGRSRSEMLILNPILIELRVSKALKIEGLLLN